MEKNKKYFEEGEANEWFRRNKKDLESEQANKAIDVLVDWLTPFQKELSKILDIGCGSGHILNQMSKKLMVKGYGVEPSIEAVAYINSKFPSLHAKVGFGDDVPFKEKFDMVHLGFFLYLVDRKFYLRCISEADRLVKPGGFLSIIDFDTPFPYSNNYRHQSGIYSHKKNNSDVFVASGLYSVMNKFHFSHSNLFFDKDINERVSLTLLYRETDVFGEK